MAKKIIAGDTTLGKESPDKEFLEAYKKQNPEKYAAKVAAKELK